jgi:hypothetical protein
MSSNTCPICTKNNEKNILICDNDCGTIYCDCENEYYIIDNKFSSGHNPNCGKSDEEEDNINSIEDIFKSAETDTKIYFDFYSRKRLFRKDFDNNEIISSLNLSEDVKEKIFTNFDNFSDRFRQKYQGNKSFLPFQYILFRLLKDQGYEYPYICEKNKFRALEDIYWSIKDVKEYNNFNNYLSSIDMLDNYEIYIMPMKIVIIDIISQMKYDRNSYLLTIDDEIDLVIKYFTKFLPKVDVRPEYHYKLFIMEMEEQNIEITFENILRYIINKLNNEIKSKNNIFMIEEEIN